MKRPVLVRVAIAVLPLALLPLGSVPSDGAEGTDPTYHRVEADTFGSDQDDFALSLAAGGRLLVAGGYAGGPIAGQSHQGGTDAVVRVYNRDFSVRWTHEIGTPGDDGVAAVATDGWVVVAGGWTGGDLGGPSGGHDRSGWVKAFRPDGTERWSRRFGSVVSGVAVTDDAIYVGGRAAGYGQVKAYAHGGRLLWVDRMQSSLTPTVTHLAAADGKVFYATGYRSNDELARTYVGSLDGRTGQDGWFRLHSTDGDAITAFTAAGRRVYVSSTGTKGITAYRSRNGVDVWSSDDVRVPGGERMRFATAIHDGGDDITATFVGYDSSALVTLSPGGDLVAVQAIRKLWPSGVVGRRGSVFVGGYTKAAIDGDAAGGWDCAVARFAQ